MAKIKAFGDTLMISTSITIDTLKKIQKHAPEALVLKDDNGDEFFAINEGDANVSKYGICFCSVNPDGTLFMTTNNVVCGLHDDPVKEKILIEDNYATILDNLIKVENQINEAMVNIADTVERVSDSIEIC